MVMKTFTWVNKITVYELVESTEMYVCIVSGLDLHVYNSKK